MPSVEKTTFAWFSLTGSVACFLGPAGRQWSYTYWAISVQLLNDQDLDFYKQNSNKHDLEAIKTKLLQTLHDTKLPESKVYTDLIEQTLPESIYVEMSAQAQLPDCFVVQQQDNNNSGMIHDIVLVGDAAHTMMASYGQGKRQHEPEAKQKVTLPA
jgi:2-polyprenyl-6-methoxyphenol hydroxylase-like FAD-dependent oxidoreductase